MPLLLPVLLSLAAAPLPQDPAAAPPPPGREVVDELWAIVNDQVLTRNQVLRHAMNLQRNPNRQLGVDEAMELALADLLTDMLFREGFRMSDIDESFLDRVVEDEMEKRVQEFGSVSAYARFLRDELDMTMDQQQAQLRRVFASLYFQWVALGYVPASGRNSFQAQIFVRPSEIARYYEEHLDEFRREHLVEARILQLADTPGAPARERLEEIRGRVLAGELDFTEACGDPGIGNLFRRATRGRAGRIQPDKDPLAPAIRDFLREARTGELSEPLELGNGRWALVLAEEVTEEGLEPLDDTLQLQIAARLAAEQRNEIIRKTINQLRRRVYIWGPRALEVLDRAYPPDPEPETGPAPAAG